MGNKTILKTHAQSIDCSYFSSVAEYILIHNLNSIVPLSFKNIDEYFGIDGERVPVQLLTIATLNRTNIEVYKVLDDISDDLISYFNSVVDS